MEVPHIEWRRAAQHLHTEINAVAEALAPCDMRFPLTQLYIQSRTSVPTSIYSEAETMLLCTII